MARLQELQKSYAGVEGHIIETMVSAQRILNEKVRKAIPTMMALELTSTEANERMQSLCLAFDAAFK